MILFEVFLTGLISVVILLDITLLLSLKLNFKTSPGKQQHRPFVSILVAARNEEKNIVACLESLKSLNYPKDRYEVLIGNDASEDNTLDIATGYASKLKGFSVFDITNTIGETRGKANVLAQLAHKAHGDYFFITDADCRVGPEWVNGMLAATDPNVGTVTGMTVVEGGDYQNMDWLFALGMVKVIADCGKPVTAMGNNMCVLKEAYRAIGGYESIPFSVTEDFELFLQVSKHGFDAKQLINKDVLVKTNAIKSFKGLLQQRKRWMKGAVRLSWFIVGLLLLQAIYHVAFIVFAIINWPYALLLGCLKTFIQGIFIDQIAKKSTISLSVRKLATYEFYSAILSIFTSVFYLMSTGIIWKGRKY